MSLNTIKRGTNHNQKQRYFCKNCKIYFQRYRSINTKIILEIWKKFVWQRQTLKMLSDTYGFTRKNIQAIFKHTPYIKPKIKPCSIILIADCTFFSRYDGLCIFYAVNLKKVITYCTIRTESKSVYEKLKQEIEELGFKIMVVVIDGKKGVKEVFKPIPIQMCHFHQISIIRRYITNNPRIEAAKELKKLVYNLCKTKKIIFVTDFQKWCFEWDDYLKEKTYHEDGSWHYTHKRLRSARRSIKSNLPYLFTFEKFPELKIPNTTNELESLNGRLKELLYIHSGYKHNLKIKIIEEILGK